MRGKNAKGTALVNQRARLFAEQLSRMKAGLSRMKWAGPESKVLAVAAVFVFKLANMISPEWKAIGLPDVDWATQVAGVFGRDAEAREAAMGFTYHEIEYAFKRFTAEHHPTFQTPADFGAFDAAQFAEALPSYWRTNNYCDPMAHMNPYQWAVYSAAAKYATGKEGRSVFLVSRYLAGRTCKMSPDAFHDALQWLVNNGWLIRVSDSGPGVKAWYSIASHNSWVRAHGTNELGSPCQRTPASTTEFDPVTMAPAAATAADW